MHFLYEWSGEFRIIGAIAPTNESVWEHFKLGFWPMCIYAAIEYRFIRVNINNFFTAKAVAVYLIPVITALIFYIYTAATGTEILIVDILIFLIAIIAGQLVSYKILISKQFPRYAGLIAAAFIVLLGLILILFTFYTPHLPVFLDSNTGTYGISR